MHIFVSTLMTPRAGQCSSRPQSVAAGASRFFCWSVRLLLRLSFAVCYEDVSHSDEESEGAAGDMLSYVMNEKDAQRQAP